MCASEKRVSLVAGLLLVAVSLLVVKVAAIPVPSQFELEGNAVVDGGAGGDDWANTVPPPPGATSEALASVFIADGSGNASIFTTGGSKDISDLGDWRWKDQLGGLPDKDNITNAYAAAYTNAAGELIVYFGADRFDNSGDAQLGFWFFRANVKAVGERFVGDDGVTPSLHTIGDILVLANLVNGGAEVSLQVFRWVGGSNPLQLVTTEEDAQCGTNSDDRACFIGNVANEIAPWAYTPKSGPAGTFPPLSFFEGGINLTQLLGSGGTAGCFSAFMAETRSSQSSSATLKDFALGVFNTCDMDISKACPTVTFDATTGLLTYNFSVTVTNSGFGSLFDITVHDSASGGFQTVFTLGTLAAGESHTFNGSFTLQPGAGVPNPPTNTATGTAAASPGGLQIVNAGTASATCPPVSFDANLTVSKVCDTRLEVQDSRVVVAVDISGMVCNVPPPPGSPDFASAIADVTVTDDPPIAPINLGTLAPGECKTYAATYFPDALTVLPGDITSNEAGDQVYEDTVTVTGTRVLTPVQKMNTATANCPLCPPAAH